MMPDASTQHAAAAGESRDSAPRAAGSQPERQPAHAQNASHAQTVGISRYRINTYRMRAPWSDSDALLVARLAPHFTRAARSTHTQHAPPLLRALWASGSAWHLLPDGEHCGVFGFNVIAPDKAEAATLSVWDDAEEQQAWAARHGSPRHGSSCASAGWLCFATFSEYDTLFVCVDEASPCYGDVHAVVNNCDEESVVAGGLPAVLLALADAVEARAAARGAAAAAGGGGGDDTDPGVQPEQLPLCCSLRRMRDAVLSV